MSTLGSVPRTPYPGTVSGSMDEAMAQMDALIAQLRAEQRQRASLDPAAVREALAAIQRILGQSQARTDTTDQL